jgi:ABC-type uncharacterized transport system permease subunit
MIFYQKIIHRFFSGTEITQYTALFIMNFKFYSAFQKKKKYKESADLAAPLIFYAASVICFALN